MPQTRATQLILDDSDSDGSVFYVDEGTAFILLTGHAGGTWKLQVYTPDDVWEDIADASGGVSFDSNGLVVFYAQPALGYRLSGGTAGAKAWLLRGQR